MRSQGSRGSSFDDDDDAAANAPLLPLKSLGHDDDGDNDQVSSSSSPSRSPSPTNRSRRRTTSHHPTALHRIFQHGSWLCAKLSVPTHPSTTHRKSVRRRVVQYGVVLLAAPLVLFVCAVLWWGGVPQSYAGVRRMERELPQHRWKEVRVDGTGELVETRSGGGKARWEEDAGEGYLRFPNHLWGHGFNNIIEETLLEAYLAHISNRAFVFEDYVWSHVPFPYTLYDFGLRHTRVPLNAFLSGFIAGANVSSSSSPVHLSVSAKYYEYVCPTSVPEEHRIVLSADDAPDFPDGVAQMDWWAERIKTVGKGKRCVEIREGDVSGRNGKRLFDFGFFGSLTQLPPLVPKLLDSPVLKHFAWSGAVDDAVERTLSVLGFSMSSSPSSSSKSASPTTAGTTEPPQTIPGLLAIHLRRGDYFRHCARLAKWESGYMGFNLADAIRDRLDIEEALKDVEGDVLEGATDESARGIGTEERRAPKPPARDAESKRSQSSSSSTTHRREKRWWYWAGRAGQRLTSQDPTSSSSSSGVPYPSKARYGVPPRGYDPHRLPGKVPSRIKKEDFDFGRARVGAGVGPVWQEPITPSGSVRVAGPVVAGDAVAAAAGGSGSRNWRWWGSGSRKGSSAVGVEQKEVGRSSMERRSFSEHEDDDDEEKRTIETRETEAERRRRLAIEKYYLKHCLPSIEQIVTRAGEVRKDWEEALRAPAPSSNTTTTPPIGTPLTKILLLSNGWPSFLLSLSDALGKEGWTVVDPDEGIRKGVPSANRDVEVAVDMALAERAEVFLGNGFSTLSGNVVLLRMGRLAREEGGSGGSEGNRLL